MPLYRRPNPTDPGDAADLSTPQGISEEPTTSVGETAVAGPVRPKLSDGHSSAMELDRNAPESSRLRELVTLPEAVNRGQAASATTRLRPSRLAL
jgi:hypothetical protein